MKLMDYSKITLHKAAHWGYIDLVKKFIEEGADVNALDNYGCTPLHYAGQWEDNNEICRILIDAGACVNVYDKNLGTPLWYAEMHNHVKNIEILKRHGGVS